MIRATAALAAGCLIAASGAAAAADDGPGDKLPEPALRFAKDATARVMEAEREWLTLVEGLVKAQAEFAAAGGSATTPREQATRHLAGARRLLEDRKRVATDLARFRDTLTRAASRYREAATLCTAQAAEARAREVKDDYLLLAEVYAARATAAERRAKALTPPAGASDRAAVVEEGNLFLERFLEALPEGATAGTDREVFAGRLKAHAERCRDLAGDLARAVEGFLEGAEASEVRNKVVVGWNGRGPSGQPPGPPAPAGRAKSPPTRDLSALAGTWTATVTVRGVRYFQVLRLSADGACVQTLYRQGAQGRGPLVGTVHATCEWDADGVLDVYHAGWMIERGQVTFRGKHEWTYEILTTAGDRDLAGTTITFTRDGRR